MSPQLDAIGSHKAVIASVVVAAIAVTACALVAIAFMLGWIRAKDFAPTPASIAFPAQQVTGTAPGVALLPGETLVTPDTAPAPGEKEKPRPTIPQYARPAPATPVPAATAVEPASPKPAPRASTAPKPVMPSYARTAPEPVEPPVPATEEAAPRGNYCVNCGTVLSTTANADMWDVRVRFEDGTTRLLRYPTPPPFRNGQRVRMEDGRLVRNY